MARTTHQLPYRPTESYKAGTFPWRTRILSRVSHTTSRPAEDVGRDSSRPTDTSDN
jgi:hypothetical protein